MTDTLSNTREVRPNFTTADLASKVLRQSHEVAELKEQFFKENADKIVACCQAMVQRFDAGGRLYTFGNGGSTCDAIHFSVEFMHPIIEKRPPLPCISLTTDIAVLTAIGNDQDFALIYSQQLKMLGKKGDMAIGLSTSGKSANVNRTLQMAREMGMMTIGFAGRDGGRMPPNCDYCFVVPSFSIPRIQETHETLLHIIWDLIHVIRGEEDVI
ncbi:MAG TPA: SIS domain-containing protein [Tepidisphaeraceae bacterium]|jgi:D-sedoheptulose 7-phosphate isomerase